MTIASDVGNLATTVVSWVEYLELICSVGVFDDMCHKPLTHLSIEISMPFKP